MSLHKEWSEKTLWVLAQCMEVTKQIFGNETWSQGKAVDPFGETHVSSSTGTRASLDDINYRISLDNFQVEIRKPEAHSHNSEA
eukprot:1162112-Pelagomonas_calceolata.AAC.3